ncbi:MAG: acyl-CoA dehydrogenase family protein [Burkholderiales bacterium]|nr:acyl-CoA dehydrogenase family protein [Burkholderiales bacterium]
MINATPVDIDYDAFRSEVDEFARERCPPALRERVRSNAKLGREDYAAWQRILNARGWAAPGWPKAFGGTGWDMRQRYLFESVMAARDCPPQYHHGLGHIGPVMLHFGTPEQQRRFLPGILDGSDWWCQGYSEPGAGSDLASLKTRAVRDGDHYVVSGQKIWTSHAHEADWMYTLVRTSQEGRKQEGITLLLIPLALPGIRVLPIRTIDGWHHLNEVFLDEVRVPADNRLGEEGQGWRCAKFLLDRERLAPAIVVRLERLLQRVAAQVAAVDAGQPAPDAAQAERLLLAEAEVRAARELLLSAIDDELRGVLRAAKSSALKLHCSELAQRIIGIAFDALGPRRAARFMPIDLEGRPRVAEDEESNMIHNYLFYRSRTIAGGTSEVQKNVIARELFGA